MTTSPNSTDGTALDRLTLTIDGLDLEDDVEALDLLEAIEETIQTCLESEYDQDVDDLAVDVFFGHWYASVSTNCPDCGDSLDLKGIHLGDDNDAYALATCPTDGCEWEGDAVYRIIDLDRAYGLDYESSVRSGAVTPEYETYLNRSP